MNLSLPMGARSSLLLMACASVAFGVLASGVGLDRVADTQRLRLNFWNGFTGPDGRAMLRIIRQFNESHPGIEVTMQRMDWSVYYNKLMVAGIDDRGPDVFVVHASALPRFQRAKFIGSVDALFSHADGLAIDDFDPKLLGQLRYRGHLLGVPMDIHPQGMYVNTSMLRDAGLLDASGQVAPPLDRDSFLQYAKAMRIDHDGDGRPEQWGFSWSMWRNNFMSLMPQFGGRCFNESGRCVIDSPANIDALRWMVSLSDGESLVPAPESNLGWVGFRQGRVAMVFDGVYMLGDLKRLDGLEYQAAPLPQIGPQPGTHGDSHVLCVSAGMDDQKRGAALTFLKFVSDHGLDWAEAGQVPARRSARQSPEFERLSVPYAFSQQLPYVQYPPRSPAVFELQQQLDYAVEKALRGRATPQEALRQAQQNFEQFVERSGLPMLVD